MPIEEAHNQMKIRQKDMFQEMDKMHERMMKGFGGSNMFDDPFFNNDDFGFGMGGNMFARADQIMNEMRKQMSDMPRPDQIGKGQFVQQTYKKTVTMGPDGRP